MPAIIELATKKKRIRLEACDRCSISCSSRREVDETYCHRERLGTGPDPISTAVDRRHCSSSSSRRRHSDLSEPPGTGHAASSGRQRGASAARPAAARARAFQASAAAASTRGSIGADQATPFRPDAPLSVREQRPPTGEVSSQVGAPCCVDARRVCMIASRSPANRPPEELSCTVAPPH